jgi:hypothetical protein
MSQVTKTTLPSTSTANVNNTRVTSGARNVASSRSSEIEATSPGVGASFGSADFYFEDTYGRSRSTHREEQSNHGHSGLFNANSQTFAALFEKQLIESGGGNDAAASGNGNFGAFAAKLAAEVYETNARVISGENKTRGLSLSMSL